MRYMDLSRVADVGLSSITNAPVRFAADQPRFPQAQTASTGFILPRIIYQKMRGIQASAEALNLDIQRYVRDPGFNNAWDAWFTQWRRLHDSYAGPTASILTKWGSTFETEELNKLVEENRRNLLGFYADYPRHTQPDGRPVPPPSGQAPVEYIAPAFSIPWWIWALGGVAVAGVVYLGYRTARELTAKRKVLETKVLPKLIGADLAEAAAARDVSRRGSLAAQRDHAFASQRDYASPDQAPMTLEDFAERANRPMSRYVSSDGDRDMTRQRGERDTENRPRRDYASRRTETWSQSAARPRTESWSRSTASEPRWEEDL